LSLAVGGRFRQLQEDLRVSQRCDRFMTLMRLSSIVSSGFGPAAREAWMADTVGKASDGTRLRAVVSIHDHARKSAGPVTPAISTQHDRSSPLYRHARNELVPLCPHLQRPDGAVLDRGQTTRRLSLGSRVCAPIFVLTAMIGGRASAVNNFTPVIIDCRALPLE
jgi:hypothetical protein